VVLYRYNGKLLRTAGGLAGHERCCCDAPDECPAELPQNFTILADAGGCFMHGCTGTLILSSQEGCDLFYAHFSGSCQTFPRFLTVSVCCVAGVVTGRIAYDPGVVLFVPLTKVSDSPETWEGHISTGSADGCASNGITLRLGG
jgi:hypothetical protein